jgi:hypothetical protein
MLGGMPKGQTNTQKSRRKRKQKEKFNNTHHYIEKRQSLLRGF